MGLPWGQVVGSPSTLARASSTGSEITCSHLPASSWASAQESPRMSVRKRSARRWRRTTRSARDRPLSVRVIESPRSTRPSDSMRWIISDTAGRDTSRRSAMRAWITSMSSSRSSQMASQYSSKAGWYSLERAAGTGSSVRQAPLVRRPGWHGPRG